MLRLPRLQYLRPRSVAEAADLAASTPGAMFIAGGTDLVPNLKRRQFDVSTLISLNALTDTGRIEGNAEKGVTIGAGATLDQIANHPQLQGSYRALGQAAASVSTPQVRYMGTLGGNLLVDPRCNYYNQTYSWRKAVGFCLKKDGDICLVARSSPRCWAVSSSDTAPVALALNAQITLQGAKGRRRVRAADIYKDDGIDYTTKSKDEVITTFDVPAPSGRMTSAYWKLRRRPAFDFERDDEVHAAQWKSHDGGCRSHARQRRVLALCHSERSRLPGRSFMRRLEESLAVCFVPSSALRLADPRKLELGAARLLQQKMVAGDFQVIN